MLPISRRNRLLQITLTLGFLIGIYLTISLLSTDAALQGPLILAALFGGYMAMATGASL